jgi:hypothetical protein
MNISEVLAHLPVHRQDLYRDFYKLDFDHDDCPVKRINGRAVFHPILAAYVIFDFVSAHECDPKGPCLDYALRFAASALKRAESFEDALVFLYNQGDGLSYVPGRYFSALTQAWYIIALCKLNRFCPQYRDTIVRTFKSLLIPIESGGVLVRKPFGWIVEEYPHSPALYTLNGWMTVLSWIIRYVDDLETLGLDVQGFLQENINALVKLLPLYDASFCLNSRYQLTGFTRLQLIFDKEIDVTVDDFAVEIPEEGTSNGALKPLNSRWKNYLERSQGRLLQFNVVLSLISFPVPNRFRIQLRTGSPCSIRLRLAKGAYRPSSTGMPTERWDDIGQIQLSRPGEHLVAFDIPFDAENLFAYPTNFKKFINGKYHNVYHFIHIWRCAELFNYSGENIFKEYCVKFLEYSENWRELCLPDTHTIQPYFPGRENFATFIRGLLNGAPE